MWWWDPGADTIMHYFNALIIFPAVDENIYTRA
jgi:hypothetical protein